MLNDSAHPAARPTVPAPYVPCADEVWGPLRKVVRREAVSRGARHDHLACGHYVAVRRYARELPYCRCVFCARGAS